MSDDLRLEVRRLPNHALQARVPLRPHHLIAVLPGFVRRRVLAETAPGLALSQPLGMLVTGLAVAGLAHFLGGPDWGSTSNALVAVGALATVLGIEVGWRTARQLRTKDLGLAVGKGQLLIWQVGSRYAEVDVPLDQTRVSFRRGMLVVEVADDLHAWEVGCSSTEVRNLVENIEAIQDAFGGASDIPTELRAMREAEGQHG